MATPLPALDPEKLRQLALLSSATPAAPQPVPAGRTEGNVMQPVGAHGMDRDPGIHPLSPLKRVGGPPEAPDIGGGAPVAPSGLQPVGTPSPVKPLTFAERQKLPLVGAPGSAENYQSQLARIADQKANPLGTAENHPGVLGKIGHALGKVGNIAGDIFAPATMGLIPGTDLNRRMQEHGLESKLGQAETRENTETERKAAGTRADRTADLAERKEDFEEGKETKPGSIDEQALAAKMKEINPETKKPNTAYEARIALAQGIEDTKPGKEPGEPKTVTMLDKPGGTPFLYQHDPKGNYSGTEGTGQWKKIGPAQPNATSLGIVGTMQPLLNPDGSFSGKTFNNKTGKVGETDASNLGGATTGTGARLANTERNQFNTQYVKPSTDIEQNYKKFQNAYHDYQNNPATGAASMVALAQHLGSTFGSVKGTQMGENMISEHKDAIGLMDRIDRYVDRVATGQQLSASQWKDFNDLISNTRQIQWETTAKESVRRHQPVDFLPADVHINLKDDNGKIRHIPGNRVQEYLDKGAQLAD
jgi:hypothetical protein